MTFQPDESGQGFVEFAMLLALVAVTAIATLMLVGVPVDGMLSDVVAVFPSV